MGDLFGTKLRTLRVQHGLSQVELAGKLALAQQSYVSHLETGKKEPSLELLIRVAHVFTVSTDYLLRDTVPVEPPHPAYREHSDVSAPLGEKLMTLRLTAGLTQTTLAHHLGLAYPGYISNLENGSKFPSLTVVVKIADFFAVTTDWLLVGHVDTQ